MIDNNIYRFIVQKLNGDEISLSAYTNKVLLIVNTASQCGFTPQYKELVALKNEFAGSDFEILAFPSNDFGGQEPLEGSAIGQFCESFGVNFPIFDKIRVRGPYADTLYQFFADKKQNGVLSSVPRWNFHKFLISRSGIVTDFFYPFTKPMSSKIRKKITRLLAADK
jgi:glutathione peroxidase